MTKADPTTDTQPDFFTVLLRVRYNECDAQHVVFNARYGDYVDIAATELWRAMYGSYEAMIKLGIDTQVVKLVTEWKSSAVFDEVLGITVKTGHIGNTSFSFHLSMNEYPTGRLVATSEIVYVTVDPDTLTKKTIPDAFRQKLEAGVPGKVINFAGVTLPSAD